LGFYQHLIDPTKGGYNSYQEYCPLAIDRVSLSSVVQCRATASSITSSGENFGIQSACFRSTASNSKNLI
jgi:hypothetical protein